jgi:formate hydrogenlyase subunit 3/multisubunit Na+/H+ antiporter MnhD subunit
LKLPIPKVLERRLRPMVKRGEEFLRDWEWTWTTAFIAGVVISFAAITAMAVIPSWMLYFSEKELGATKADRLRLTIRDMVVTGYVTVVTGVFVVTAYKLQVIRRRLRGEAQAERFSGGYR